VAGRILDGPGYRVLFPLAGILGIVAALVFGRLRFDQSELRLNRTPSPRNFGSILKHDRRYAFYLAAVVFWGLSALVPSAVIPFVQVDRLHISYTELGWLNLALSLIRLPAYYYFGRAVDRIGPVRCLQYACLINLIVVLPYIWVTQAWMLIPTFVASGIVGAAVDLALINAAIQLAREGQIQEYSALQSMIIGVRGMIAPFIGVAMLRAGAAPAAVFAVAGVCAVLAALLLVKVKLPSLGYGEN
jgi:MFS family permease